jgi:hypothetical protein
MIQLLEPFQHPKENAASLIVDCPILTSPELFKESEVPCQPLVLTPAKAQCEACVIVPARNEAEILEQTLTALAHQVDLTGQPLGYDRYEVILFANNCTDDSAAMAQAMAQRHPNLVLHIVEKTLPTAHAHIGWVRRRLMDEACQRLMAIQRPRGIIASTDGDTQVAPHWIAATLQEIARGADAVGGRIITDRGDRHALHPYARRCHLQEVGYRYLIAELEAYLDPDPFDPWPRHFQHYGASFAVTADCYAQAGGIPPVRTSEDVALYKALLRVNARFRHSPQVRVTTSARSVGRAQQGLADQLKQWAAMGVDRQPFWVESAAAIATRLRARAELRQFWDRVGGGRPQPTNLEFSRLAHRLALHPHWLTAALAQAVSFGALWEQVEQTQAQDSVWAQRWPAITIEQAMTDLRNLLEPLRHQRTDSSWPSWLASSLRNRNLDHKLAALSQA